MSYKVVEKEKVEKYKETEYYCDICNNLYNYRYTQRACSICGRDVCSKCSVLSDTLLEEDVCTDYPSKYCNICWNKEDFRKRLNELVQIFELDKAELFLNWKKESLRGEL